MPRADFNDDEISDVGVFRPSSGGWFIRSQFTNVICGGTAGDIPVPADYNGDFTADIAVYRPSNSSWYVKNQAAFIFGLAGDFPVIARDTKGDGDPYQSEAALLSAQCGQRHPLPRRRCPRLGGSEVMTLGSIKAQILLASLPMKYNADIQPANAFPASDFDQWADSYDDDVVTCDRFPFAGYPAVLKSVLQWAAPRSGMTVLDIGIGTGNLAQLFLEAGCRVWGTDFAPAMLAKARLKIPEATLVLHDLRAGWPAELDRRFERIVAAYAFHHFSLKRKVSMLTEMSRDRLEPGGRIVIADVSFPSLPDMQEFAATVGDLWEEEPYWLADEAQAALKEAGLASNYQQVSPCGGVYCVERA